MGVPAAGCADGPLALGAQPAALEGAPSHSGLWPQPSSRLLCDALEHEQAIRSSFADQFFC